MKVFAGTRTADTNVLKHIFGRDFGVQWGREHWVTFKPIPWRDTNLWKWASEGSNETRTFWIADGKCSGARSASQKSPQVEDVRTAFKDSRPGFGDYARCEDIQTAFTYTRFAPRNYGRSEDIRAASTTTRAATANSAWVARTQSAFTGTRSALWEVTHDYRYFQSFDITLKATLLMSSSTVVCGNDLPLKLFSSAEPYVLIEVDGDVTGETLAVRGESSPRWDESFDV